MLLVFASLRRHKEFSSKYSSLPTSYTQSSTTFALPFSPLFSLSHSLQMKAEEVEDSGDSELLDLNLAVIPPYPCKHHKNKNKNKKRKTRQYHRGSEGKIYELLQMREQMLRVDPMKQGIVEDGKGLHLIHLLLLSATAVDDNNTESAADNLYQLYQHVSLSGDSVQRVAAYFADGLSARFLTKKSPFYDMIIKEPTPQEEFLAFTELYKASPYYQFAHFTANQEIIEAFEAEEGENNRTLHVIDFDLSYGFQWPSLIQSLSEKATVGNNRVCLRITGFGRNSEELVETETRLVNFASSCSNLTFEFQGVLLHGSEPINLRKKKKETVAVNLVFHLHTLTNSMQIFDTLKSVYSFNPSIVILVEKESSRSLRSFLSRFMESLHYFAAMFDSLDDCLSPESAERLCIEKNHLGKEIKGMMNYDKDEETYQKLETWKGRMERNGFVANKLSSRSVIQAKLLLKIRSHTTSPFSFGGGSGFRVLEREEGCALSLGWQDRFLITASAWKCM